MKPVALAVLTGLILSACNPPAPEDGEPTPVEPEGQADAVAPPSPPLLPDGSADAQDDAHPDLTPAPLTPEAERGEKGARNVLLAFIRAIERKEFDQARRLMGDEASGGTGGAELAGTFADFGTITVSAPTGTMEGAAGTLYYTAPVTITGSNGQSLAGEIELSRVNDVPGATEEQLRWHVRRFDLETA